MNRVRMKNRIYVGIISFCSVLLISDVDADTWAFDPTAMSANPQPTGSQYNDYIAVDFAPKRDLTLTELGACVYGQVSDAAPISLYVYDISAGFTYTKLLAQTSLTNHAAANPVSLTALTQGDWWSYHQDVADVTLYAGHTYQITGTGWSGSHYYVVDPEDYGIGIASESLSVIQSRYGVDEPPSGVDGGSGTVKTCGPTFMFTDQGSSEKTLIVDDFEYRVLLSGYVFGVQGWTATTDSGLFYNAGDTPSDNSSVFIDAGTGYIRRELTVGASPLSLEVGDYVQVDFSARVRYAAGSDETMRVALLDSSDTVLDYDDYTFAAGDTDWHSITSNFTISSANVTATKIQFGRETALKQMNLDDVTVIAIQPPKGTVISIQ